MTIGSLSYATSVLGYFLLAVLLTTAWRGRLMGLLALTAVVAMLLWAGFGVAVASGLAVPAALFALVELLRDGSWLLFLAIILTSEGERSGRRFWRRTVWGAVGLGGALTLGVPLLVPGLGLDEGHAYDAVMLGWILLAILGLLLVEQVFRNRLPRRRWEIKHLCLGLGAIFAYDLFLYSDGLLMQRLDPYLWEARGIVNALIVPLIAVSAARNPDWSLEVHVSRNVVFHSATLSGAGVYLMAMAAAGYYIRFFGGAWGAVLQIAFLFAAGIFLLLLLFSGQLRSRLRVLLSRHFFSFKYDYREEWLRFTDALSRGEVHLPAALVSALGEIVDSSAGMLWARGERGAFELLERRNLPEPETSRLPTDHPMVAFLMRSGWVIDLDELRRSPDLYEGLETPGWLDGLPAAWLVVPLIYRDELCGFVVLAHARTHRSINWEDRALLKTAGRQAASHLAQYLSDQALVRARQFEAFNQLSAYVAHDLKNLLAQQSLIISNAERHKGNPAFIEDVIRTVHSSVERMNRLMAQLRNGVRGDRATRVALDRLVQEAVDRLADRKPSPRLQGVSRGIWVMADGDRLRTVFGHIIQNAQEATSAEGSVSVRLRKDGASAVVEIQDDGMGMTADFIRERLFRPFDSTKGLTGMGIGAFESRELVRLLGGELTVMSRPGEGSLFGILLPCAEDGARAESGAEPLREVAS